MMLMRRSLLLILGLAGRTRLTVSTSGIPWAVKVVPTDAMTPANSSSPSQLIETVTMAVKVCMR
jgi:hypothetical protein